MKNRIETSFTLGLLLVALLVFFTGSKTSAADVEPFLGRWALTLPNGPGWLEVRQEQGYLDADILWLWGSVVPVSNVYMDGDKLFITRNRELVRQKDEEGKPLRSHTITTTIELSVEKNKLKGKVLHPSTMGEGVRVEEFTGVRIPPLSDPPDLNMIKYGESVSLLNDDREGWRMVNENSKNGWSMQNGVLVNDPVQPEGSHVYYGNLRTDKEYEDFNLKLEVNVPEGSNSGVYLRGIYEVQVMDSYDLPLDSHHMGAVYSRITPAIKAEKPAGEWQTMDITLYDRYVTVVLNGVKIIDNQPLYGVTGGAMHADQFKPGPLYLQGDHGKVKFRNIVLTPIKN